MGHVSDAVDQYQVTSDQQRAEMSKIIHGEKRVENCNKIQTDVEMSVMENSNGKCMGCMCKKDVMNLQDTDKIGEIVKSLMTECKGNKATIKIEIEFHD